MVSSILYFSVLVPEHFLIGFLQTWPRTWTPHSGTVFALRLVQNNLRSIGTFSYQFLDEKEDPLPQNAFGKIEIGKNMRGLRGLFTHNFLPKKT